MLGAPQCPAHSDFHSRGHYRHHPAGCPWISSSRSLDQTHPLRSDHSRPYQPARPRHLLRRLGSQIQHPVRKTRAPWGFRTHWGLFHRRGIDRCHLRPEAALLIPVRRTLARTFLRNTDRCHQDRRPRRCQRTLRRRSMFRRHTCRRPRDQPPCRRRRPPRRDHCAGTRSDRFQRSHR